MTTLKTSWTWSSVDSSFRPIGQSSLSSEHIRRVKTTVSTVPWSLVCSWYFPGTRAWLIKNRCATTLKLVKPICDGRHRRGRVTVHSIQVLFEFAAQFPFRKQESNHRPILLFFHFSKFADTPASTRGQNKTTSRIRLKF